MENNPLCRREFVGALLGGVCALAATAFPGRGRALQPTSGEELAEVMFYQNLEGDRVECQVCPRKCRVADQERGFCGNKENRGGRYYTLVHSRPCAVQVDPIEKKPFFHFLPGSFSFSIAAAGCNMECQFCQNWQIAQFRPEQVRSVFLPPEEVVRRAKEASCQSIAYTYSEPVSFYEYMFDTAVAGGKKGVRSVVVTNGYINEEPLKRLCDHVAAVKVDLKAFTERFYKEICRGELQPVKETLLRLNRWKMWTEIVVLIVPGQNDKPSEIRDMARWIREELSPDVPLHFTRFHPAYRMQDLPPTPVATLERCAAIGKEEGLHFVYIGNVPGHREENTRCPGCGQIVISRKGFGVLHQNLREGRCGSCAAPIPGVWV